MVKELEFRISSGLKNIIGKELITNDLIAIFELVKNSYDANSKDVKIVFQNILEENRSNGAKILVIDHGQGMSYRDLVDKFLFVGYSEKKNFEDESLKKNFRDKIQKRRVFAGAKGIGRFSCDRLGTKLNLYTKKSEENLIHHLSINWEEFEVDQKKEFRIIKPQYSELKHIKIRDYDISDFKEGTILEITSLNDDWNKDKLIKLKRYLQRLINPAQVGENQEFKIYLEANEFREDDKKAIDEDKEWNVINGLINNFVFEKLGIKTTEISSHVSKDGKTIFTEVSDKGRYIFRLKEKNEFFTLNNLTVKLFYLNPEAKKTFTRIMGIHSVRFGSIFLYKNGVRIHPYGDEGDDWLGLEKRKGQGYARFLATRELIGRIEINGYQPDFIEVSSRDGGIVKNENYNQLVGFFIDKVLRRLERYVVEAIDWEKEESSKSIEEIKRDSLELIQKITGQVKDPEKEIHFNKDLLDIMQKKEIEKIPELIKNVEKLTEYVKNKEEKEYINKQLKSFKKATRDLKKEKKDVEDDLKVKQKESLFLTKAISTDKDVIINLNHTIENSTLDIKGTIDEINDKIKEKRPIAEIAPQVDEISLETEKISLLAGFVSLANFNMKVEWITKDIILYITDYLERIKHSSIKSKFRGKNLKFVTRFRPLEISIVLDNFISNSKKSGAKEMTVSFKIIKKKLHMYVADNGKGVDSKVGKYIFTRGYTTTEGSGIGLSHIKNIIKSMNGTINFAGNNFEDLGKGACFEVIL
jgi:anti-sigma regulatory factor (Ser/Thr protein kinase)